MVRSSGQTSRKQSIRRNGLIKYLRRSKPFRTRLTKNVQCLLLKKAKSPKFSLMKRKNSKPDWRLRRQRLKPRNLKSTKKAMRQNKTIPRVKRKNKLSIILFRPEKWGKSIIAHLLSEEQQQAVINLDKLYSWCLKNSTSIYPEVAKYLAERKEWRIQELLENIKEKGQDKRCRKFEPSLRVETSTKITAHENYSWKDKQRRLKLRSYIW